MMNIRPAFNSIAALSLLALAAGRTAFGLPNLLPAQPDGWSDRIVVSNVRGNTTDSPPFLSTDILYVDWAIINKGNSPAPGGFSARLSVDGFPASASYTYPAALEAGALVSTFDFSIGSIPVGKHTLTITVDSENSVVESKETDNTYTRTIDIQPPDHAPQSVLIRWPGSGSIAYGTPLGAAQLNATATVMGLDVAGVFVYSPPAGSLLPVGTNQILSLTFTPADPLNFLSRQAFTSITVTPAPLTMIVNDATREYGLENPTFSATFTGLQNGDTASVLGELPRPGRKPGRPAPSVRTRLPQWCRSR